MVYMTPRQLRHQDTEKEYAQVSNEHKYEWTKQEYELKVDHKFNYNITLT